jgi:hypothetical protein
MNSLSIAPVQWQAPDNPNTGYFVNELNSLKELTKNSPGKKMVYINVSFTCCNGPDDVSI